MMAAWPLAITRKGRCWALDFPGMTAPDQWDAAPGRVSFIAAAPLQSPTASGFLMNPCDFHQQFQINQKVIFITMPEA
jgi:hypothetical protein